MINTLTPGSTQGHDEKRNEALERISREYGKPDEKQREAVKKLGKDEFFKIMITQIQHQDPLKPAQNEQMAAEMAQFSALEQMVNVNQNLEKLTQAQQPLQNLGAANLIGKFVTADSSRFLHTEAKYSPLSFELPADAAKVRIAIINDRGENVKEIERSGLKKGPVSIDWDGRKANNMLAGSGQYMMQIQAENDRGQAISVRTTNTQVVHGVGFEGKETVLYTGDVAKPVKMLLRNVTRIVDTSQSNRQPGQAAPMVTGPGGMQIGGLENVVGGGAEALAGGAFPSGTAPEIPEERVVEGATPGMSSKFMNVNADALRKANQKPEPEQSISQDELRQMIARPDLSAANLAAEAVQSGKAMAQASGNPKSIEDVNPAALERGYKPEQAVQSAGQSVQSSADGSTAGKWSE